MNKLKKLYEERINLLEAPVAKRTRMSINNIVKILRQIIDYIDEEDFPEFNKVMRLGIEKGVELTNQSDSFFSNLATESESKQEYIIISLASMPISISDIIEQFIFTNDDLIKKIKETGQDLSINEFLNSGSDLTKKAMGGQEAQKILGLTKNIIKNEMRIPEGFGKYTKKDNLFLKKVDIENLSENLLSAKVDDLSEMTDLINQLGKQEAKIEKSFADVSGESKPGVPQIQNNSEDSEGGLLDDAGFTIQLQGDKMVLVSSNGGPKVNISPQMISTFFMALMKADDTNIEITKSKIEKNILALAKTLRPKS